MGDTSCRHIKKSNISDKEQNHNITLIGCLLKALYN